MKLLALRCPECNHPLAPENDHIVVACEHCHAAVQIGDEGVARMPVRFAAPRSEAQVTHWLPFWVFHGHVRIDRRVTQGSSTVHDEALRLWAKPRDLYVPAWELSLQTTQEMGSDLIQRQPVLLPVSPTPEFRLTPVTFEPADAVKMLEFIVLAIEARRSDWLQGLDFRLEAGEPELWALPADETGLVAL